MSMIDGGTAESVYGGVCRPATEIWPDPSVTIPPEDATEEEVELLAQQVEIATALAWSTLQVLTAYQLSICPVTVRPCRKSCASGGHYVAPVGGYSLFWPSVRDGQWTNIWCGHRGGCGCTEIQEIVLPGPVGSIVDVTIDGEVLDPASYRVDGDRLVRQDGQKWPLCQDFNLPLGEEGTWSVTYHQGATADVTVRYAAGVLANEWLNGILGSGECRLPSGTVNVVRQGVAFDIEKDMFEQGLTGIPEVDAVTARFNPFRRKLGSAFFNPDARRARQTTFGR